MKVTVHKDGPGTFGFSVRKTRRDENPSRLVRGCTRENLGQEIAKAVLEVSPTARAVPLISP